MVVAKKIGYISAMTTERVWKSYHNQLRTFIRSRVSDETLVDDLLQSVFLKIHSKLASLQSSEKLTSWLYQITRNVLVDHYKSKGKLAEANLDMIEDESSSETEQSVEKIAMSIRFFILQLDEPFRKTMILSELVGMKQNDIAKQLGEPYSTIKSRVKKGRELVKELMLACCHYEFDRSGKPIDFECRHC